MNIGKKIANSRQEANLSQEELAKKVGISRGYLAQIETGSGNVKAELLGKFSQALNVPLSYFFGEDNPELTEFAEKAKKYDELISLIKNSGLIEGSMNKNVVVNGNKNHVVVNAEQQKLIERLLDKDSEERDMIFKLMKLQKEEKEDLIKLYSAFKKVNEEKKKNEGRGKKE